MRTSADAIDGNAMDEVTKLTTADASAPAKAACHFMGYPLPVQRLRPYNAIMARVRERVKFNRAPHATFFRCFFLHRLRAIQIRHCAARQARRTRRASRAGARGR